MPVESAADRAVFVNPDEFGVVGIYTLPAGASFAVNGIYDAAYRQLFSAMQAGIASADSRFTMRAADLPAGASAAAGDMLTVGFKTFSVRVIEPDETGNMVILQLEAL